MLDWAEFAFINQTETQEKTTNFQSLKLCGLIPGDSIRQSDPIGGFDRPLKLVPDTNLLKLLISSRGRSKSTDRFRRIPTLGFHRIPTLGIRMSVHNLESDRILSAGLILPDPIGFFDLGCEVPNPEKFFLSNLWFYH